MVLVIIVTVTEKWPYKWCNQFIAPIVYPSEGVIEWVSYEVISTLYYISDVCMHIDIKYTQSPTVTMIYGWTSAVSDLVFCSTDKLQLSNSQIIMARLSNPAVRVLVIHCINITQYRSSFSSNLSSPWDPRPGSGDSMDCDLTCVGVTATVWL